MSVAKVFVLYPRGLDTGGPEAIHQLVHTLRAQGCEAYLVPMRGTEERERVAKFADYDAPEARIEDAAENWLVAPEIGLTELRRARRVKKAVWWLSIDASPAFSLERARSRGESRLDLLMRMAYAFGSLEFWAFKTLKTSKIEHFVQSQYAWSYIFHSLNVVPSILSDWTPVLGGAAVQPRVSRIAYNPKKAGDLVERIKAIRPNYDWLPLENMSRAEVIDALSQTHLYFEAGFLPGKDRLPREASMCGAAVVVGRRGAGAFSDDFPLAAKFKYSFKGDAALNAAIAIDAVLADPEGAVDAQADFRAGIHRERGVFSNQVERIFIRGQFGADTGER